MTDLIKDRTKLITNSFGVMLPLVMSGWLSTGRHGRLLCDAHQNVIWHNNRFAEMAESARAFRLERDGFVISSKREQAAFQAFVLDSSSDDLVLWLTEESERPRWVLQCQRIETVSAPLAIGIRIAEANDFLIDDFRHFESFFGLTRQEAVICRKMLEGQTVSEIVESLEKSHDTVRFHVRNIYRKVGVSSREKLFASLRHFLFS